jgi:hypothetical protein
MKPLLAGILFVVCLLAAGLLGAPAAAGAAPALTPTASPTPGVVAEGPNLVPAGLDLAPYGGARPSLDHPVQIVLHIANLGTRALPAGSALETFFYVNAPPNPNATPAFTASVTLPAPLLPQQQVTITTAPWMLPAAGLMTLSAWINPHRTILETNYDDNTLGPVPECIFTQDGQSFLDVFLSDYYHTSVEYLACRGVVSGYDNGNGTFSFRPGGNTTRGQFAKMLTLALGWPLDNPATPTFQDVPPESVFYSYIETAVRHGVISGYTCGTDCLEFRPGANLTRGQLAKMIALAKGWPLLHPPTPRFRDVPPESVFYPYIETVAAKGVVSGYDCGPACLEFRPGNTTTRGQLSKMLYLAVTQR